MLLSVNMNSWKKKNGGRLMKITDIIGTIKPHDVLVIFEFSPKVSILEIQFMEVIIYAYQRSVQHLERLLVRER